MGELEEQLAAIDREIAAEQAALKTATEKAKAQAESPEAKIRAKRIELAEAQRERKRIERDAADDAAWLEAKEKYGAANVRRINSEDGAIILRAMSGLEWDAANARAGGLYNTALQEGDIPKAVANQRDAFREETLKSVFYPPKDAAKSILGRRGLLWEEVFDARDSMLRGQRQAAKKGIASSLTPQSAEEIVETLENFSPPS